MQPSIPIKVMMMSCVKQMKTKNQVIHYIKDKNHNDTENAKLELILPHFIAVVKVRSGGEIQIDRGTIWKCCLNRPAHSSGSILNTFRVVGLTIDDEKNKVDNDIDQYDEYRGPNGMR